MSETEKHCDTCEYSYYETIGEAFVPGGVKIQHCGSAEYNSPEYTAEMLLKDWGRGYCRFWAPKIERIAS